MFNKNFYPTPAGVVKKMIYPYHLGHKYGYVLEPSAGKGDILDVIKETVGTNRYLNLYAVEIEPELRSILEGKGYPVVGSDFLDFSPRVAFSHIIMNPPFDRAEDHLLHAWEILQAGEICCLMDARSLQGKTEKEKLVKKLIADHGKPPEHIGPVFKRAERTTSAEIVIVRLSKGDLGSRFDFDVTNDREEPEFGDGTSTEVALNGFVANLLQFFNAAADNYAAYNVARQNVLRYIKPFNDYNTEDDTGENGHSVDVMKLADESGDNPRDRYNAFITHLTESAWLKILNHPRFQAVLTERARKMMTAFRARQRRVDFNAQNIASMFDALLEKQEEIMNGAVDDAFDTFTKYYEDNRSYFEGWKSNKAWRVARKVVLPNYIERGYSNFHINYRRRDSLNDIDRAMCVVSGRAYDDIVTIEQAMEKQWAADGKIYPSAAPGVTRSEFFKVRYFLKGTIHLTFLDEELWKKFNLISARNRNWLPPGA